MLHHILKINFRHLLKDKSYTFINLIGLTLGISAFLLIALWVRDELTFDHFHEKADRIGRIVLQEKGEGGFLWTAATSPRVLAPVLLAELPEVEQAVRINETGNLLLTADGQAMETDAAFVDPDFFDLFDFPFLAGNPDSETFLEDPSGVLLSSTLAAQVFGDREALGRELILQDTILLTVSGIFEDMPSNSNFDYSLILPFSLVAQFRPNDLNKWKNWNYSTFLLLNMPAKQARLDDKMTKVFRSRTDGLETNLFLQPLKDIHLRSNWQVADRGSSRLTSIYYLFGIGLLMLFIACINYTNLSTAQISNRTKAVSVRKISGASRPQLFTLFLGESVLLTFAAVVLSAYLIQLIFPYFNAMTGKQMVLRLSDLPVLMILFGAGVLAVLMSGIYPAIVAAACSPIKFLRGLSVVGKSNSLFRRGLLVGQFAISALLIIGTVFILRQLEYMRNAELGFDKENVFSFALSNKMKQNPLTLKEALLQEPAIQQVTLTNQPIYRIGSWTDGIEWPGHVEKGSIQINRLSIDEDFYDLFGVELKEGRPLPVEGDDNTFLINETAARVLGMSEPVGQLIRLNGTEGRIVGVLKDFHFRSLHREINPLIVYGNDTYAGQVFIKAAGKDMADNIAAAERIWKKFEPSRPFDYHFLDAAYAAQYEQEERIGNMMSAASLTCILISMIGLMGLVAFTVARRTREIGIRKILGATVADILGLLSSDLIRLILVGVGVAFPLAWYFLNNWLEEFAYRIELDPLTFVLSGSLVLFLALLVLSAHALRAASANPVEALRSE